MDKFVNGEFTRKTLMGDFSTKPYSDWFYLDKPATVTAFNIPECYELHFQVGLFEDDKSEVPDCSCTLPPLIVSQRQVGSTFLRCSGTCEDTSESYIRVTNSNPTIVLASPAALNTPLRIVLVNTATGEMLDVDGNLDNIQLLQQMRVIVTTNADTTVITDRDLGCVPFCPPTGSWVVDCSVVGFSADDLENDPYFKCYDVDDLVPVYDCGTPATKATSKTITQTHRAVLALSLVPVLGNDGKIKIEDPFSGVDPVSSAVVSAVEEALNTGTPAYEVVDTIDVSSFDLGDANTTVSSLKSFMSVEVDIPYEIINEYIAQHKAVPDDVIASVTDDALYGYLSLYNELVPSHGTTTSFYTERSVDTDEQITSTVNTPAKDPELLGYLLKTKKAWACTAVYDCDGNLIGYGLTNVCEDCPPCVPNTSIAFDDVITVDKYNYTVVVGVVEI